MELKWLSPSRLLHNTQRSNRTFMELKWLSPSRLLHNTQRSNRTFMELKFESIFFGSSFR